MVWPKSPVTRWCNNLSVAGKWIKFASNSNSIFVQSAGFLLSGSHNLYICSTVISQRAELLKASLRWGVVLPFL